MSYIHTTAELQRLCEQARVEGLLALDLEFIRERTYVPRLALIQIAVSNSCAIIDPLVVSDLSPLLKVVTSCQTIKVLHAAAQDMEILYWHAGTVPTRVFDTQIAAAMVGLGEQLSYGRLVEALLGVTLTKEETYSDWLQRPLSPAQVAYALDDVRYLLALYTILATRLEEMGRTAWAAEEFRKFDNLDLYQRQPRTLFRRIRRGRSLAAQGLAILRELAEWRESEAQRRDCPPGSVLRDEALVDIARKAPRTLDDLQRLRSLPARELERSAAVLLAIVERGLAVTEPERPLATRRPRLTQKEELMVKLLDTCLKALCQRQKLSAACIGNREDLEGLVYRYRHGSLATESSPLLEGWRGALVGQELLAVLDGRRSVHLEPANGGLVLSPRTP
jgi:ribonuclease D